MTDDHWDEYIASLKNSDGTWDREALEKRSEERQEMYAEIHDAIPGEYDLEFIDLISEVCR